MYLSRLWMGHIQDRTLPLNKELFYGSHMRCKPLMRQRKDRYATCGLDIDNKDKVFQSNHPNPQFNVLKVQTF